MFNGRKSSMRERSLYLIYRAISAVVTLIGIHSAWAELPSPVYAYVQAGTEGAGVGMGLKLNPSWAVRAEVNAMNRDKKSSIVGVKANLSKQFRTAGVYADYFPGEPSFRITTGLLFNQTQYQYDASVVSGGATLTLNDVSYKAAPGETVSSTSKSSPVMPYIGVGYGHDEMDKMGFTFHADVGVGVGRKPETTLVINSPSLATDATLEPNRQIQEKKIQNDLKSLRIFPVIKMGIGLVF
jgi:hypothetical protein